MNFYILHVKYGIWLYIWNMTSVFDMWTANSDMWHKKPSISPDFFCHYFTTSTLFHYSLNNDSFLFQLTFNNKKKITSCLHPSVTTPLLSQIDFFLFVHYNNFVHNINYFCLFIPNKYVDILPLVIHTTSGNKYP